MPFRNRKIAKGTLDPQRQGSTNYKYSFTNFPALGTFTSYLSTAAGYGNPTGVTGDLNYWNMPLNLGGGLLSEYHIKGTQTILAPRYDATGNGPDIGLDQTNGDGLEILYGGDASGRGKHVFTVGTDAAFFAKASFTVAVVAGANPFLFGLRKVQAAQVAYTSYTDYALIGWVTSATPALIQTATRLASGTAVITSTTQTKANATQITLEVRVDQFGVTTFILDGAFPTVTQSFTFAAATQVEPILFFNQTATLTGALTHQHFSCGYQPVTFAP